MQILQSFWLLYPLMAGALMMATRLRYRRWAILPPLLLIIVAYSLEIFGLWPSLAMLLLAGCCYGYIAKGGYLGHLRPWLLYGMIMPLVLLLSFRLLPGVDNPALFVGVQLSAISAPFTIYQNWDKALMALLLWLVVADIGTRDARCWRGVWLLPLALVVIFPLGMQMGVLLPDIKMPGWPILVGWGLSNLLITCVLEEAFFRGVIQRGLMRRWQQHRYGQLVALLLTSLLFGLVHFAGGWQLMLLAAVAGIFYGAIYWLSGRLWLAVVLHFLVNLVHFIGFSYPALAV